MDKSTAEKLVQERKVWHHTFEVYPGVMTPGVYNPEQMIKRLQLPERMDGVKVLEIGPADGAYSLDLHRRGADLTIIDYRPKEGPSSDAFGVMERIAEVEFNFHQCNVYELRPELYGTFDKVLFLGVLYHLPDMVKALRILHEVCRETLYIESHYEPDLSPGAPAARYYVGNSLNNDTSNFWGPNEECLRAMCQDAGFLVERVETWGSRIFAECKRTDAGLKHVHAYENLM